MWVFIAVGIIPFIIVAGIIIFNVISAGRNYSKTRESIYGIIATQANNKMEKNESCAYCGKQLDGDVCPHCGAGATKK